MKIYRYIKIILFLIIILILLVINSCGKNTIEHFSASIDHSNNASNIINSSGNFEIIKNGTMEQIIENYKNAYAEAKKVNINLLNQKLQGFGNRYNSDFIIGLKLIIEGYNNNNQSMLLEGQSLLDNWDTWYSSNIDIIRYSRQKI